MNKSKCEILENIFRQSGIFLIEDDYDEELQIDSLQFVTLIVEIEAAFSINIDEQYYINDTLKTFNGFLELINSTDNAK